MIIQSNLYITALYVLSGQFSKSRKVKFEIQEILAFTNEKIREVYARKWWMSLSFFSVCHVVVEFKRRILVAK